MIKTNQDSVLYAIVMQGGLLDITVLRSIVYILHSGTYEFIDNVLIAITEGKSLGEAFLRD